MIPESWAKIRERRRFSTANGWETVETWTGPAGPNEATVTQWLANFSGYTSLEIEHSLPTDDGNSVVTAEIGFGISGADGQRLPPEHPDYGLISRKWTKHTNRVPISLLAHPSVKPLHDTDADWPERLRLQAMAYAIALRQFMRGEREEKPDADSFRTAARPDGFSGDQYKDIEVWLFRTTRPRFPCSGRPRKSLVPRACAPSTRTPTASSPTKRCSASKPASASPSSSMPPSYPAGFG
jgi:hypothetical protein